MDNNDKKAQFHEALSFLVESATINSGVLTTDEIKSALNGLIEDESMYQLVYDYLAENKITIQGYLPYTKKDKEIPEDASISDIDVSTFSDDNKEQSIVEMYLEDIMSAGNLSDEDEQSLLERYLSDHMNKDILNELTECNLKIVPPLTEEFRNKGVSFGDLLQEGSLGLIEGIMTYRGTSSLNDFHEHITSTIKNAMNDAVLEQNASSRIGTHAADRANELDRASVALSKELDRTPTLEELAKYLSLPEDEVERIMKMSLNALTIDESTEEDN